MKIVILRLKGGIGNQLFSYAFARRLSIINNAKLFIDIKTGFEKDYIYNRTFQLNKFKINNVTYIKPNYYFYIIKKFIFKFFNNFFQNFVYKTLEENNLNFDSKLLHFNFNHKLYVEGYFQSEEYFKDIENIIREDLTIIPPTDDFNINLNNKISNCHNSVCLHIRFFEKTAHKNILNISIDYYKKAIFYLNSRYSDLHFFIFSDDIHNISNYLDLLNNNYTIISHNNTDDKAYVDLWLMKECKYFITANSTFSWWAAWLCNNQNKLIITPKYKGDGINNFWNFDGLIPNTWIKI
jgi:hypothetical protein